MRSLKILLATGGSGGHIFPALVTAQELKTRGHTIIFAGVFRQAAEKIQKAGFEYFEIPAKGFLTHSLSDWIRSIASVVQSLVESYRIIQKVKPDVVVGFGGYGSFALVMAAVLTRVPAMIQEQNVVPGKANRALSFFVKKIAVGFEQAQTRFPAHKVLVTGCPSRSWAKDFDRGAILKEFSLTQAMPIILVLGGSQGSRRINGEFIKTAELLKKNMNFGVIHLCGVHDVDMCRSAYQRLGIAHWVASFTDEMAQAYAVSDLVISRAGAMTVTEIAGFSLPAILIPYPYAAAHQKDNALVLTKTQVCRLIEEKDLTPEVLQKKIEEMLSLPMAREQIAKAYENIYRPNAAFVLANEIEKLKP